MIKDNKFMKEALVTKSNLFGFSTQELVKRQIFLVDLLLLHTEIICAGKKEAVEYEIKLISKELANRPVVV